MRLLSVNRYSIPTRHFQGVKKLFVGGSNPNELPHRWILSGVFFLIEISTNH